MYRNDSHIFLLYIEPKAKEKLDEPINDEYTELMEKALSKAKKGNAPYSHEHNQNATGKELFSDGGGWRGLHCTDCGQIGGSHDYLLENGMITNCLAPFYVAWYRTSIPKEQWEMIENLKTFYE